MKGEEVWLHPLDENGDAKKKKKPTATTTTTTKTLKNKDRFRACRARPLS